MTTEAGYVATADAALRRMSLIAWIAVGLGTLHFADHAFRGYLVVEEGLDATWNHSGWPFQPRFTPFTGSLIAVYGLVGVGLWLTARRRAGAGYWLVTAVVLGSVVVWAHVLGSQAETPEVIYRTWGNPLPGILAVVNTASVVSTLVAMGTYAVLVGRRWGWGPGAGDQVGGHP